MSTRARRRLIPGLLLGVLGACSSARDLPSPAPGRDAGPDAATDVATEVALASGGASGAPAGAGGGPGDDAADAAGDVADGAGPGDVGDAADLSDVSDAAGVDVVARVRVRADQFAGTLAAGSFASAATSWSRAIATAAGRIVTANPDSDSVTLLSGTPKLVRAEIAVGRDPRSVALTDDGRYAVAVNRGDATVSLIDLDTQRELFYFETEALPYGAVIAQGRLHVTEWATANLVTFDLGSRALVARTPLRPFPAGIAHCGPPHCALPGGRGLLVTHFYSGELSQIDADSAAVVRVIATGADTNASQHVAIAPDGQRAYLPQTRSFADNPIRQFDSSVFPVVNVVDLATLTLLNAARITLDTADQPVGLPFAVDFLADGHLLVAANAASDDLSVIDLDSGRKVAHVEVGSNPQGIVSASDGRALFVNQVLDGSLATMDAQTFTVSPSLPLTTVPLAPQVLRGKKSFWSSNRPQLARDQWMACATCHFDGFHDARTWRSFPDGPRNTTALFNLADTTPLHWSGDLDELADVEATVRFVQAGQGLAPALHIDTLGAPLTGASEDLDALAAFLRTLRPPPSPHTGDGAGIARGRAAFDRLVCASCHAGAFFTDRTNHDVGTGDPLVERNSHGRGVSFDTPALRGLWLTAPYFHDGSAATLDDVFSRGPAHDLTTRASAQERSDLVIYLKSL